ncbi:hypothetical protein D9C73_023369 [Collichthys lucidus]|uniref:Uncharacterized protein n=1 Tax=Collichthys lucidus TaxID=240159 RepID=A0A4U5VK58_COLLU|nr:hypothetical protein D9C73_023369 [Collichthys lucidus]
MRGAERAGWVDGGEWVDEVSEESNADQQWTRRGAEEVEERLAFRWEGWVYGLWHCPSGCDGGGGDDNGYQWAVKGCRPPCKA